jgi:hypothetical protein
MTVSGQEGQNNLQQLLFPVVLDRLLIIFLLSLAFLPGMPLKRLTSLEKLRESLPEGIPEGSDTPITKLSSNHSTS